MGTLPDSRISTDIGPFAMVPKWLTETGISSGAIHAWVMLALRADRNTQECWPSRATLAKELGCDSLRTVDARIRELVNIGALTKDERFLVDGKQTSTLYMLHMVQPVAGEGAADCTEGGAASCARTRTTLNQTPLREAPPQKSAGTASPLPDTFRLSSEMQTWAQTELSLDPSVTRYETQKFVDHFKSVGGRYGRKTDWIRTWRNWMRRASEGAMR